MAGLHGQSSKRTLDRNSSIFYRMEPPDSKIGPRIRKTNFATSYNTLVAARLWHASSFQPLMLLCTWRLPCAQVYAKQQWWLCPPQGSFTWCWFLSLPSFVGGWLIAFSVKMVPFVWVLPMRPSRMSHPCHQSMLKSFWLKTSKPPHRGLALHTANGWASIFGELSSTQDVCHLFRAVFEACGLDVHDVHEFFVSLTSGQQTETVEIEDFINHAMRQWSSMMNHWVCSSRELMINGLDWFCIERCYGTFSVISPS